MCAQGMGAQAQYHPMVMPAMVSNAGLTAEQIQSLLAAQQEARAGSCSRGARRCARLARS